MIRLKPWQRPLAFFAYLVNDSRKALSYFIKNYNLLKTDIVAACEMTLLLSILVSPFYLWKVHSRSDRFFSMNGEDLYLNFSVK
ncbi:MULTISPECIES: hypothetical protein [Okeania]|uniref:Uncharacterized protein n=1 Tax=Okeania hirsuta TaxID=1458930 RepID=A0A3N6QRV9_9CYAN|nr:MULTISPECIES: hypothetical protein [Okeania]NET13846.1 hypothetical protein [Okeania sp. SIO1H6]NES78849.1 hypothetical protein [Okeania sp. SIO1H4]NET21384.1 hypothetical protein [Okeania sp. SIO1H5]NET77212.1 hypothetical protein [Okeania sp. SIO1F9]NET95782.1 hypothetical protein [Okeania sp. SIO1H2]